MQQKDQRICTNHKKQACFINESFSLITDPYPCEICCMNFFNQAYFTRQTTKNNQKQHKKKIDEQLQQILDKMFDYYEENIMTVIQTLQKYISDQIVYIKKYFIDFLLRSKNQNGQHKDYQPILTSISNYQKKITQQTNQLLEISNLDHFETMLKIQDSKLIPQTEDVKNQNSYTELISYANFKQKQFCKSLTISSDNLYIAAGCQNVIIILELYYYQMKYKQVLKGHTKNISYLSFININSKLISGGDDGNIIIWSLSEKNVWTLTQILSDHQYSVTCLKLNQDENILVSGGVDCCVRFWKNTPNKWIHIQKLTFTSFIIDIEFPYPYDKVYLCDMNKCIMILSDGIDQKQWQVVDKINTGLSVFQIKFINYHLLMYLTLQSPNVHVIKINDKSKFSKAQILSLEENIKICDNLRILNDYKNKGSLFIQNGEFIYELAQFDQQNLHIKTKLQLEQISTAGIIGQDNKYLVIYGQSQINVLNFKFAPYK